MRSIEHVESDRHSRFVDLIALRVSGRIAMERIRVGRDEKDAFVEVVTKRLGGALDALVGAVGALFVEIC